MASFKQGKIKYGFLETTTSGGTLTLTTSSLQYQILIGSSSHSVVLPAANAFNVTGIGFNIINTSTGTVTVYLNDGVTVLITLSAGSGCFVLIDDNATANGVWSIKAGVAGTGSGAGAAAPGQTITAGTRAIFGGGNIGGTPSTVIDYSTFSTLGNGSTFGTLTAARDILASCSSSTRGVFGGGRVTQSTTIDYITIATLSNAITFGSLSTSREGMGACANATRGVFGGGFTSDVGSANTSVIDYITIATLGNTTSFGSLVSSRGFTSGCGSTTRGVFGGGYDSGYFTLIDYITIASTGNATTFGQLTSARYGVASCSNATRGLFAGGTTSGGTITNIDYITIATTANSAAFGSLLAAKSFSTGSSSPTYALFGGSGGSITTIEYVLIATLANSVGFGNLSVSRTSLAGCSNAHGGL